MIFNVLLGLWLSAEALHVGRDLHAGVGVRLNLRSLIAERVSWMVTRPFIGILVLLYAFAACLALAYYSGPALEQTLAVVFGIARDLDPSFPFDETFRLPVPYDEQGRILPFTAHGSYTVPEVGAAVGPFFTLAFNAIALFTGVIAVIDRWTDLLWREDEPLSLQTRLVVNGICAGVAALVMFIGALSGGLRVAAGVAFVGWSFRSSVQYALMLAMVGSGILLLSYAVERVICVRVWKDADGVINFKV